MIRRKLFDKKGAAEEFMGINLVNILLFSAVLLIAVGAVFYWRASFTKVDIPSRTDVSFDRLCTVLDRSHELDLTSYSTLSLLKGAKIFYFSSIDSDKNNIKRKDCGENKNCLCISMPKGSSGEYVIAKCHELDYALTFKTTINVLNNDAVEETKETNNCISSDMYYCSIATFSDEGKYSIKLAQVMVSNADDGTVNLEIISNIES